MDWVSRDFDVQFSKVGGEEVVSYRTWTYYSPSPGYAEVFNSTITQLNPICELGTWQQLWPPLTAPPITRMAT